MLAVESASELEVTHELAPLEQREHGFDAPDGARGRAEEDELDVVEDERDDLEERAGSTGERDGDEVRQEESGRGWQLRGEQRHGRRRVLRDLRDRRHETGRERDDDEAVEDHEDEVAVHERQLDPSLERDSLELGKHCMIHVSWSSSAGAQSDDERETYSAK